MTSNLKVSGVANAEPLRIDSPQSLPPNKLLIRERNGIIAFQGPFQETNYSMNSNDFPLPSALRIPPIYDNSGQFICVVPERQNLAIYNSFTLEKIRDFAIGDAQKVEFSPSNNYLITWSLPPSTKAEGSSNIGNLKVWSVPSGELLASYSQKSYRSDIIQWTPDDNLCFRQVTNEIHIYQAGEAGSFSPSAVVGKVHHVGFTQFKIAKIEGGESKGTGPQIHVAFFNPEAGGKPARVTIYALHPSDGMKVDGPLLSRTIFGASEAQLMWNKSGSSLLIHSQSDVDSSNASYYGAMGCYLVNVKGNIAIKVEQTKEGPVHAVSWSPTDSDRFVIAAGNMPCQSTMCNERGEPVYQFGAAHRNVISWSPHGRFLCLAGFGNLAGEMDFYDVLRLRKLGSNISHCSTTYQWSPDSRYFMTASLAPRMNVDNGFKVFKYNGTGPVYQYALPNKEDKAFDCFWKTVPSSTYPNRGPTPPPRGAGSSEQQAVQPALATATATAASSSSAVAVPQAQVKKTAAYRPPNSTGELSNFMSRANIISEAPVGKVKKEGDAVPAAAAAPAKFVPSAQKQRIIPGMAPQAPVVPPKKKPQQQQQQPSSSSASLPLPPPPVTNKPPASASSSTTTSAKPSPAAPPAMMVVPETAESKEKKIKAISKKLKQIQEIKAKVSSGQVVEPEQLKKLETEGALQKELESLS